MRPLPRTFYDRDTIVVARELLGKLLVCGERIGRIVEVEAYLGPHDRAAHSARGLTRRNAPMFGPPGYAYVYLIYGIYCCMNVVTERAGHASAVLLRALEPVRGLDGKTSGPGLLCNAMRIDRRLNGHDLLSGDFFIARDVGRESSRTERSLTTRRTLSSRGKRDLSQTSRGAASGAESDGAEADDTPHAVLRRQTRFSANAAYKIVKRPRIGVDYAGPWARRHLRFYIAGNAYVSRP